MSGDFIDRVFQRLRPPAGRSHFEFWRHGSRPTGEGLCAVPSPGTDVDAMVEAILDVDHYRGNIDHVLESRAITDAALQPPEGVRFYQRLKIPMVADVQFVNEMHDHGERDGWRVISWSLIDDATNALNARQGARFDYNDGAWLLREDAVAYALSSAPRKSDVGRIKFALMTKGADAGAQVVLEANIKGMLKFSASR